MTAFFHCFRKSRSYSGNKRSASGNDGDLGSEALEEKRRLHPNRSRSDHDYRFRKAWEIDDIVTGPIGRVRKTRDFWDTFDRARRNNKSLSLKSLMSFDFNFVRRDEFCVASDEIKVTILESFDTVVLKIID